MLIAHFDPFPVLVTSRLILRQLELSDAEDIFHHRADEQVNTYLEDFRHHTLDDTLKFIHRVKREIKEGRTLLWVLSQPSNPGFMGTICFWNIDKHTGYAETGYTLASQYHGKGYMQEALDGILKYGFGTIGLKCVEAYTHMANRPSARLLERNGFTHGLPKKPVSANRIFLSLHRDTYLTWKK